ncbi:hypothetical protein BD408DRAFT_417779 [Parasitella parasitica]|nr:hypothetical protein BD408DRAFT_417779 [Parasitella parasitica]
MTRRKNSPAAPTMHACERQDAAKHPASCVGATTTDEIDDIHYDQFDNAETRCGCGMVLAQGWACDNCRISCPGCNRSLTDDPQDFCSRCSSQCPEHGLYKNEDFKSCPECV